MESAILDNVKKQMNNLKVLTEELQVQMALGKAEARDLLESERKNVSKFVQRQRDQISKVEAKNEAGRVEFLKCVQDLESSLYEEIPTKVRAYDKYKQNMLQQIYKLEDEIRKNYPSLSLEMKESLDVFKAKMDAFRVNLALHDKDNPEKVEKIRDEFTSKLTHIREVLNKKEEAQSKLDNFVDDLSESFTYLRRAITDLTD